MERQFHLDEQRIVLLKGDGNVLERILSPYLVEPETPDLRLQELRSLTQTNLNRCFYRHYSGFFQGMVRQYEKEGSHKVKRLLYMFRVALTGIHLLLEGEVLPGLVLLLERYPYERVTNRR